jgi:hypothetical protein
MKRQTATTSFDLDPIRSVTRQNRESENITVKARTLVHVADENDDSMQRGNHECSFYNDPSLSKTTTADVLRRIHFLHVTQVTASLD